MLSLSLSITSAAPVSSGLSISILAGSGYAGSTYGANLPGGQWHADGVPIAGATAQTWQMDLAQEGASITYRLGTRTSNGIEMWMPDDIPAADRVNGGWWDPKRAVTVSAGKVTSLPDLFGTRPMSQPVAARQPGYVASAFDGGAAVVWPDEVNGCFLAPPAAFAPAYWAFVIRYRDGTAATFPNEEGASLDGNYPTIVSDGILPDRVMGERGTANLFSGSAWTAVARKNGAAASPVILPLPKSLLELGGTPASAHWSLGRGAGTVQDDPTLARGWRGPMFEILALNTVPDDETRRCIQGSMAWRNGLQGKLPEDHPYRLSPPRKS